MRMLVPIFPLVTAVLLAAPRGADAGPPCISDLNGDGMTDVVDLVTVINAWGTAGQPGDVNFDGIVDVLDLTEIILGWGPCLPPFGACCLPDGSCEDLFPGKCFELGGVFQGPGLFCSRVSCPPP